MNSLSWLIYTISVLDKLGSISVIVMFMAGVATVITLAAWVITWGEYYGNEPFPTQHFTRWLKISVPLLVTAAVLHIAIPNDKNMMLIAASEVGQRVITSDQAKTVMDKTATVLDPSIELLQTWIKTELEKQKKSLESVKN